LREYKVNTNGAASARFVQEQQQKNDIKRHFKQYFKDRDCCTLVRPTVDEGNLQSLDSMKLEDLRSEFVEQAFVIRKKILQNIVPKKIHDQAIDGSMWADMIQQYIDAMNGGSVPSIENTWTYLVRQRALSLFEALKVKFDEGFKNDLQIPANERDLEGCLEFHAEKFATELQNQLTGDPEILTEYQEEMQSFIASRQNDLRNQNCQECRQLSQTTLT